MNPAPLAFISYRRADSLAAARGLLRFLRSHYGRQAVFMDTAEIRDGSDWKSEIHKSLAAATVVLPIIGRNWFNLTDEFGKRRIDRDDDWVRGEIEYSIKNGKLIIPIYIGIDRPPQQAFPACLERLAETQSRVVVDEDSESEWRILAASLQRHGFGPLRPDIRYPRGMVNLKPLTDTEIRTALYGLQGWRCVSSPVPGMEHVTRSELHKVYEFSSFSKAISFMSHTSKHISKKQHHPRWENIWRTVSVWLATWDVQFQVSQLDVDLAHYLDEQAQHHKGTFISEN
jgi:pterin-4a-carbinolamine dehydratase